MNSSNGGTDVYLNVYDLDPNAAYQCYGWFGAYHSGIEIGIQEFAFGGHQSSSTGVQVLPPRNNHPNYRESILLGKTNKSMREIINIIDNLKERFAGNSYHIIRKNCNTFSNAVCEAIFDKSIPGFVNRLARIGCVLLEINDFIQMRPCCDENYKLLPSREKSVFEASNGVAIG